MQQIKKKNHASLAGKKPKKLTTIPPLFDCMHRKCSLRNSFVVLVVVVLVVVLVLGIF